MSEPINVPDEPSSMPPIPADAVIIVPVRETVLFPEIVLPVALSSLAAIGGRGGDHARRSRRPRRRPHGPQARGEAGHPRDARPDPAARQGLAPARPPDRGAQAQPGDQPADAGELRRAPAPGGAPRTD